MRPDEAGGDANQRRKLAKNAKPRKPTQIRANSLILLDMSVFGAEKRIRYVLNPV